MPELTVEEMLASDLPKLRVKRQSSGGKYSLLSFLDTKFLVTEIVGRSEYTLGNSGVNGFQLTFPYLFIPY